MVGVLWGVSSESINASQKFRKRGGGGPAGRAGSEAFFGPGKQQPLRKLLGLGRTPWQGGGGGGWGLSLTDGSVPQRTSSERDVSKKEGEVGAGKVQGRNSSLALQTVALAKVH